MRHWLGCKPYGIRKKGDTARIVKAPSCPCERFGFGTEPLSICLNGSTVVAIGRQSTKDTRWLSVRNVLRTNPRIKLHSVFKRGDEMNIRDEVFACTRACEHLLASGISLTEDERRFLQYYLQEVTQHLDLSSDASPKPLSRV